MRRQLKDYITEIRCYHNYIADKDEFAFYGDGKGDLEQIGTSVSKELIKDYLSYLDEQKRLAKEYLKTLKE